MREVVTPGLADAPLVLSDDTRLVFRTLRREGGPSAHSGLTGRKTGDDTFGSFVRQSTAALSGKSPARIDRIAAYAARQAARAAVTAGLAGECEVQLSYIVGDDQPASVEVDSFGSATLADAALSKRLREVFDFRPGAISERMGLWDLPTARNGRFYRNLATYGHMGREDLAAPWEDTGFAARLA
jgi:S-adenosylmethionine synthetase